LVYSKQGSDDQEFVHSSKRAVYLIGRKVMRVAIDSRANPLGGGVQRVVDVSSLQSMRIYENEDEKGAQAEGNNAMGTSTICSSALSHPFRPLKIYVCSSFLTTQRESMSHHERPKNAPNFNQTEISLIMELAS
jgi:hypothetical protein